ncbi:MAG: isoprenyl transferase [Anaerohalosphaeraceae bacterium]
MNSDFQSKKEQAAERLGLDAAGIPRHIAIIMDGNGRWATERNLPRFRGHEQGAKVVQTIAQYCVDNGVEFLTLYSFSMQNWKRPKDEVDFLMHLYVIYLEAIRPQLMENNTRLIHLGRRDKLPQTVLDALDETMRVTGTNTGLTIGLALNYASQTEIADAAASIARDCLAGKLQPEAINEKQFARHLYTAGWPEVDLCIRTSGEMRISNFLLWQMAYSEFYVTPTYWPDFTEELMDKAITDYSQRSRRFGDVKPTKTQ